MLSLIALGAALASSPPQCPVERATYALRGASEITAKFKPRRPTKDWPADVFFVIHSDKSGVDYGFLPYSGNGQGIRTHLASVQDALSPHASDKANARPLGDLDYLAASVAYEFDQAFDPHIGARAPEHLLIPGLQEALWYRPDPEKREGVPMAFFDLARCDS